MANYCSYDMRVRGKPTNVKQFVDIVKGKHESKRFPDPRIYNADIYQFDAEEDDIVIVGLIGGCAWSVYSVMVDYDRCRDVPNATTLQDESRRLHLEIEVWSEETGVGFQEHYYYRYGQEVINDEHDVSVYYFDERIEKETDREKIFKKWVKECGLPENLTLEDIEDNGEYRIGGFDQYGIFLF